MGVYIRGMDMPKDNCMPMLIWADGRVTTAFGEVKDLGDAIEIPDNSMIIVRKEKKNEH